MDEVTRTALEQAWEDGFTAGYDMGYHGDAAVSNPYSRNKENK